MTDESTAVEKTPTKRTRQRTLLPRNENYYESWMQSRWRPMMGFTYMAICVFDFIIAPILWSLVQAWESGNIALQWAPITLVEGGFFHLAMGAVLGVAAWTRGAEKTAAANNK